MKTIPSEPARRRWPGVLLSLFVPGFGLLRSGAPRRAVAWFLGLHLAALVAAIGLVSSAVPLPLAILPFGVLIVAAIWMLCDSFKPGRMTWPLWGLFAGLVLLLPLLPDPAALVVRSFEIASGAMEPTLMGSRSASSPDKVVVDRLSYRFAPPQRGDLVVFATSGIPGIGRRHDGEEFFVMRLVGLPGERIRLSEGRLFAGGRLLGEEDGIPGSIEYSGPDGEYVVGPDEYFVLGDNSSDSNDSRYWGCVPKAALYGKVAMIYYPFGRAGRHP